MPNSKLDFVEWIDTNGGSALLSLTFEELEIIIGQWPDAQTMIGPPFIGLRALRDEMRTVRESAAS